VNSLTIRDPAAIHETSFAKKAVKLVEIHNVQL